MKILKSTGLTIAFMFAADMVFAAGTGMVGVHSLLVDGGAAFGEAAGIPHVDWTNLMENGEFGWLEPGVDPHAGHNHGSNLFTDLGSEFNNVDPLSCGEELHYHGDTPHCGSDAPLSNDAPLDDAPIPFTS